MLPRPSTMLPRPSCIPIPKPCKTTKIQCNKNKPAVQKVRPSCIPVYKHKQQEPVTLSTQPNVQQTTNSLPRPREENTTKQTTQGHPDSTPVSTSPQKSPLLPTPPASERISNNTNNYKQHITRPSPVNSSRHTYIQRPSTFNNSSKSTFARPAPVQQPQISPATSHSKTSYYQDLTTNNHHYFQAHHANTRISLQDHINSINSHKDTVHSNHMFQS